jgi:hypothetical protein
LRYFNDIVGAGQKRGGDLKAERLGCAEVDHQLKLDGGALTSADSELGPIKPTVGNIASFCARAAIG